MNTTEKFKELITEAHTLIKTDVDKALKLSKQAMQIAKQQKNTKLKTEARLYENMSLYYKGTNLGKLKNSLNTVVNYYEKLENRSGEDTQNTSPLVTIWL